MSGCAFCLRKKYEKIKFYTNKKLHGLSHHTDWFILIPESWILVNWIENGWKCLCYPLVLNKKSPSTVSEHQKNICIRTFFLYPRNALPSERSFKQTSTPACHVTGIFDSWRWENLKSVPDIRSKSTKLDTIWCENPCSTPRMYETL